MKKLPFIFFLTIAIACSNSQSGIDKKGELEKLKNEESALKEKINKLEAELADTTKEAKSKFVSVTAMAPQVFNHFIEVQAKIDGDEDVNVSPELPGTITSVLVSAGD